MGTLIDRFDEHDGPVRGVDFHRSQPLFVSGGDDYKIKVWNYKLRRCLFTLLGHLDYIRTVQFHHEYPWIVSASDDQTIRLWNWQSRTCLAVLTGHNHYVMSASFHPKEDLVVSASLDQTVRVWDIGGLRKKSVAPMEDILRIPQMNADLFGGGDTSVKYVLEGHDRGVNWASFHPTLPLIVSGADDRQVKLWRMNDTKAWEVDTLRGHVNNVSCVIFHAKQDIIVSNSEDKSIRVWDMSKRSGVQTFKREHDRFWVLASHPELNVLAAGHDSGMIVFKLERERPAYASYGNCLYYIKDRFLRCFEYSTGRDNPLMSIKRAGPGVNQGPRGLTYNPAENAILVCSDAEGGIYELYNIPKDGTGRGDVQPDALKGSASSAVFVARNRFAVLDRNSSQILIKNLQNEVTKKCSPPGLSVDTIFYAGTGMLLCKSEDKMILFDVQQRKSIGEVSAPMVKYVVWSSDMSNVALLSKHAIVLCNKQLQQTCTVHETIRVKSGAWDDNGVFVYTTLNHIKYCLPNGDNGIIKTLDVPLYVTRVFGSILFCLDREGKNLQIPLDSTEYLFKLALLKRQFDQVLGMVRSGQLCGQSIIAYLKDKGFPEVALHFVQDETSRFDLAIECGNIEVALQAAQAIDKKETWHRLGVEALRQGNYHIVEFSYQKTKNFERLSFLYLITGNLEKLSKMLKIAEMRGDVMSCFHNALYLGDVRARVRVLEDAGLLQLAYLTAKTHGLTEEAEKIATELEGNVPEVQEGSKLMLPPQPIVKEENWPLLAVSKGMLDGILAEDPGAYDIDEDEVDAAGAAWGEDLDLPGIAGDGEEGSEDMEEAAEGDEDEDDGWDMEDLELPADIANGDADVAADTGRDQGPYVAPPPGIPAVQKWVQKCSVAGELAAAGDFDSAMKLLNRQLGISHFEPLKQYFLDAANGSHVSLPTVAGIPSLVLGMERNWDAEAPAGRIQRPSILYTLDVLEEQLKKGYKLVTEGKFVEAQKVFTAIIHTIPLLVVETRKEVDDAKELLRISRDYLIALRVELKRKEVKDDPKLVAELAAYFTHCNLQPIHSSLSLRSAMSIFYKMKNYNTAATFCRRLLELNPPAKIAQQARQVLLACEKTPSDAVAVDYDARNPFDICTLTFKPIYRGNKYAECPFTGARFAPECKGQVCPLGGLTRIGDEGTGLVCSASQVR